MAKFYENIKEAIEEDKAIVKATPLYSEVIPTSRSVNYGLSVLGMVQELHPTGIKYFTKIKWNNNNEIDRLNILFNAMAKSQSPLYLLGDVRERRDFNVLTMCIDALADKENMLIMGNDNSDIRELETFLKSLK